MVNDIFIAADETTASGDTICWFTSRFSLYSITVGTSASETINVRIRVHQPSSSCFRSRSSQYLYNIVVNFVIIQGGQKSVPIRWVLNHRRVSYLRVPTCSRIQSLKFENSIFWGRTQSTLECLYSCL